MLPQIDTQDLLKFGMIPEFVGRIPVIATLDELDEEALIQILTKPRNALVKQFTHLVDLDGVSLSFTPEALKAIADEAMKRKTGARGLRSILENCMLDVMYDVPSNPSIKEVVITEEVITEDKDPMVVMHNEAMAS